MILRRTPAAALALVLALGVAPLAAQTGHGGHGAHGAHGGGHGAHAGHGAAAATQADSEATKAFRAVNERMHAEMDIAYENDVDIDFVRGMIPHHQGAVEMAKVLLAHSSDPELRALAQEIVDAQEKEIAFMRSYLEKRGAR